MKQYNIVIYFVLILMITTLISAENVTKINTDEYISVIVEFKEASLHERNKNNFKGIIGNLQTMIHETLIESERTSFKNRLKKNTGENIQYKRHYKTIINGAAFKIKKDNFDEIKKDKDIKNVWVDEILYLNMQDVLNLTGVINIHQQLDYQGNNLTGKGIKIAIIDSGIKYNHSDFGNCTQQQISDGDCSKILYGYNFINNNNDTYDNDGHGTHVSGIVGANGTFKGIAPDSQFVIYKVCDGACPSSDILAAYENATNYGVDIITMSIGSTAALSSLYDSIFNTATQQGILLTISAGNSAYNFSINSPGSHPLALTVGSIMKNDGLSSFSSKGLAIYTSGGFVNEIKPNLVGYGSTINSTCIGPDYCIKSGTSMSTPMIAGMGALIKQDNPNLTGNMIKSLIVNSADSLQYPPTYEGTGKPNITRSLNLSLITSPSSMVLGKRINSSVELFNITRTINFTHLKGGATTYQITIEDDNNGFNVSVTDSIFQLENLFESYLINFSLTSNLSSDNGYNFGYIRINSTQEENITIPYVLFVINNSLDCLQPNIEITESTVLSNTEHCLMQDYTREGVFYINTDNIVLDCNGSIFDNIYMYSTYNIKINSRDNVTIKNCVINGFYNSMVDSTSSNINYINNTFNNASLGIRSLNSNNNNIINNTFNIGGQCIYNYGTESDTLINNNSFNRCTTPITFYLSNKSKYTKNIINGSNTAIYSIYSSGNHYSNNTINGSSSFDINLFGSSNERFFNNTLSSSTQNHILVTDSGLFNNFNNSFYNMNIGIIQTDDAASITRLINSSYDTFGVGILKEYYNLKIEILGDNYPLDSVNATLYNNVSGTYLLYDYGLTDNGFTRYFDGLQRVTIDEAITINTIKVNCTFENISAEDYVYNISEDQILTLYLDTIDYFLTLYNNSNLQLNKINRMRLFK